MNKLIVALDVNSFKKARKIVDVLAPYVDIFKVGSILFTATGPRIIDYINKKKKRVFLDLKFFDIPSTVEKTVQSLAIHNVFMLTLHITGGEDMLKKAINAVKGKKKRPLLMGVTVLTSKANRNTAEIVRKLALVAKKTGLNGVVCSARETHSVKKACGKKFVVINPGIRPSWASKNDQKRVVTPKEAIKNGADFIVVGRPITKAKDVAKAAAKILIEVTSNQ